MNTKPRVHNPIKFENHLSKIKKELDGITSYLDDGQNGGKEHNKDT